jgi:primosomal protein N'
VRTVMVGAVLAILAPFVVVGLVVIWHEPRPVL